MEPMLLPKGRLNPLLRLQSDERLARLAADGQEAAFEVLVRRHRRTVAGACARVIPGDRAEDAAQQALLSAHQALLRNGPPRNFQAWVRRIAVNAALKEAGRSGPDTEPLDESTLDGVERPEEVIEKRELLTSTVRAVGQLPTRQRHALVMRELEGRSHEEIAAALGLTKGAIRQLIHRARDGVRGVASAVTPLALLRSGGGLQSGPVTEIAAGGAAGLGAKAAVTLVVSGGIAGGIALAPANLPDPAEESRAGSARHSIVGSAEAATGSLGSGPSARGSDRGRSEGGSSGPGDDGEASAHNSGSGEHGSDSAPDHSGSDHSGDSESSGSDSGSESSGSESSGSESSGSGSSGSGSESSGGSGSGDLEDPPDA